MTVLARRLDADRGTPLGLVVDGQVVHAYAGESLAVALLVSGTPAFHRSRTGRPRLPLCNMGTCFDCAVTVDGVDFVRACLTPVADGMAVQTGAAW